MCGSGKATKVHPAERSLRLLDLFPGRVLKVGWQGGWLGWAGEGGPSFIWPSGWCVLLCGICVYTKVGVIYLPDPNHY